MFGVKNINFNEVYALVQTLLETKESTLKQFLKEHGEWVVEGGKETFTWDGEPIFHIEQIWNNDETKLEIKSTWENGG